MNDLSALADPQATVLLGTVTSSIKLYTNTLSACLPDLSVNSSQFP